MGVEEDAARFTIKGDTASPMLLNHGILPGDGSNYWSAISRRVTMYVDRGSEIYSANQRGSIGRGILFKNHRVR